MNRGVPPEVEREVRVGRLAATHPHLITLIVDPAERDHLVRSAGLRPDVEVVGETVAGWRQVALELACAEAEVADGLLACY